MKDKYDYKSLYKDLYNEIWFTIAGITLVVILCVLAVAIAPTIPIASNDILKIRTGLEAYNMELVSVNDRFLVGCGRGYSSGANVTIKTLKGQTKEVKYCFGIGFNADSIKF